MVFGYNSSKHSSTEMTPFELCYGRQARLPVESSIASLLGPVLATEYAKDIKSAMLYAREVVDQDVTESKRDNSAIMISNISLRSRGYVRRVSGCFCLEKQSNRDYQKS